VFTPPHLDGHPQTQGREQEGRRGKWREGKEEGRGHPKELVDNPHVRNPGKYPASRYGEGTYTYIIYGLFTGDTKRVIYLLE